MKRARRHDSPVVSETFIDVSGGINGGVSDAGALIRHDKNSDNIFYDPARARSSRDGFRALTSLLLPYEPTSTMRYYGATGTTKTFVGAGTKIYLIENGGGFVEQTLPITPSNGARWSHANINGMLFCTQELDTNVPIFYNGTEWLSSTLPVPATTNVVLAHTATGNVDVGTHLWRIRWRFTNGASLASASISHEITTAASTVEFTVLPLSGRSDYVGFSIERTIVGETGLWYAVGDSASKTAVIFTDNTADADLGDLVPAEPGIFGAAPHFDGVIAHQDLLFGWVGSNLYVSDAIGADYGTGVLNFHPYFYQVKADDGDPIKIAVQQLDRLVIVKGSSMHAFTGFDRDSFSCTQIHGEIGTPSTRGAAADGARVFIYGGRSRIFVLEGQAVRGLGNPQITHYLDTIALTGESKVEVVNYRGDKILFGYPARSNGTNDEVLAFSMLGRNWEHYTGIRISGSLCPKNDVEFGGATMVYGDPKLYPASVALNPMKWVVDGVVVCNATGAQTSPMSVPDGLGGIIVVWQDLRGGTYNDIYAQRLNSENVAQWTANGVVVCNASYHQTAPTLCADGLGGAIITWLDGRSGTGVDNIYAQRINAAGTAQWLANGVAVCVAAVDRDHLQVVADGAGGAIFAWDDLRGGSFSDIYAQKVSVAGAIQWTANGVVVCNASNNQQWPTIVSDGAGGAIIAWQDTRTGSVGGYDLYAQRVVSAGTVAWTANGVVVCNALVGQYVPAIVADGAGGAIVAWIDSRGGAHYDIYAQRINSAGVAQWTANGVAVCSAVVALIEPKIVADGSGGAIVAWVDTRSGVADIYAQRISGSGVVQWTVDGVALCAATGAQSAPAVVADGSGGAIVVWVDPRGGTNDIYAQWVSGAGVVQWAVNGVAVCTAAQNQTAPTIVGDGADGAIAAWVDTRNGSGDSNIYAQHIDPTNSSILPGYRVWSLFDGETDEAAFDGSGGIPIPVMFETPEYDGGEPDTLKSFDRLQVYTKQGVAEFSARLTTENGSANVTFSVEQVNTTWVSGSTSPVVAPVITVTSLIWGTGMWAGSKPGEATTGIPSGTLGKRCKLRLTAKVSEKVILLGHALDFQLLPERPYV